MLVPLYNINIALITNGGKGRTTSYSIIADISQRDLIYGALAGSSNARNLLRQKT